MNSFKLKYVVISAMLLTIQPIQACTETKVETTDGSVLFSRTLEFEAKIQSNVIFIPRNYQLTANTSSLLKKSPISVN